MGILFDFYIATKSFYTKLFDYKNKHFVEASLIGKALNFGFNDYGFDSRASNLKYNN